ncbi:MAG: hypothetical protein AAFU79_25950 [Myxococcota bacterium]
MSNVGSIGGPGRGGIIPEAADAILDGERKLRELARDVVENPSKENQFLLSEEVEKHTRGIKAMAAAQSANNKAVREFLGNLKA